MGRHAECTPFFAPPPRHIWACRDTPCILHSPVLGKPRMHRNGRVRGHGRVICCSCRVQRSGRQQEVTRRHIPRPNLAVPPKLWRVAPPVWAPPPLQSLPVLRLHQIMVKSTQTHAIHHLAEPAVSRNSPTRHQSSESTPASALDRDTRDAHRKKTEIVLDCASLQLSTGRNCTKQKVQAARKAAKARLQCSLARVGAPGNRHTRLSRALRKIAPYVCVTWGRARRAICPDRRRNGEETCVLVA